MVAASLLSASPLAAADQITEDFASDPAARGWQASGDTNLFSWNAQAQCLDVTWDSSRPNSYFAHPLPRTLSRADSFRLGFDLRLADIVGGSSPGKPYAFQIAVGLIRQADATRDNFYRGSGMDSPNLFEFDYFPDTGFGATVAPTIISGQMQFASSFNFPVELTPNDLFHVELRFDAAAKTLKTSLTKNGEAYGDLKDAVLGASFDDFAVDQLAVCSYSEAGQMPDFAGSVLARGQVDNLAFELLSPAPIHLVGRWVAGQWQVEFDGQAGWTYELQATTDFKEWRAAGTLTPVAAGAAHIVDTAPGATLGCYRIKATPPQG